ncbi:translation initiation factor IF-2 [Tichowtungia aerotolerans]|uniref:Translation initiation factor IF-2 n=1 Tax=Tichowtungia aerotolerans TaxID=2697043 RepID=A0A6P1M9E6_9BACT|nr:translation initiation factor IF-2 [Tichowtungia aerotolerans]QHI68216.1 translation initiation factor IF-2 [Tichowtungia aerotolerans]
MKVHELAVDLEVSVEELLEILGDVEIEASDGDSLLADAEVAIVCDELGFASIEEARAAKAESDAAAAAEAAKAEAKAKAEAEAAAKAAAEAKAKAEKEAAEKAAKAKAKEASAKKAAEPKPAKPEVKEVPAEEKPEPEEEEVDKTIIFPKPQVAVKELAEKMDMKPNQLIAELMRMNIFASINQDIDIKVAIQIGEKHGFTIEQKKKEKPQPKPVAEKKVHKPEPAKEKDRPEDLVTRPPIVTFMGHVDHGKTSLLDRVRKTKVVAGESGGITQHIGAYTVDMDDHKITFLDTPGHAAFTAMRARGANLTDIAVLVVAAEDGVMPQTIEAINHAKAAGVTIIIAMNKMDLPAANPDRLKQQLNEHGVMVEDWGGSIGCVPVSAETGMGIDDLLERITLEAEMLELKANNRKRATGYVIEAQMEPGMGPTATLLVRDGTLKVGDSVLCGAQYGRIKALIDCQGKKVRTAGPSYAVKCLGLTGVPGAGDEFSVCTNDKEAKQLSAEMLAEIKEQELTQAVPRNKLSLDDLFGAAGTGDIKELPVIIKCDVQGSIEAIQHSLESIKSDKVKLNILSISVGNITNSDVMLASASSAIILGFHVAKENGVTAEAKREGVEIRLYSIIYELLEEVEAAMCGLLEPELREEHLGTAEIRQVFEMGKRNKIAGCMVVQGKITSRASIRIKRKDDVIFKGSIGSLKRFQNDASEVRDGQECGIRPDNFTSFEEGDIIEAYTIEKVAQKL